MFIETWVVVVAIVVVVYLIWKNNRIQSMIGALDAKLNEYASNKELTIKELCNLLAFEDARFLAKASERTTNKILAEQAHDLLITFRNNHTSEFEFHGVTAPMEESPEVRLSKAMENGEIALLDQDKEIEQEIVLALKDKMARYE